MPANCKRPRTSIGRDMNATILNVSVRPWAILGEEPCGHDTFEVWETHAAQGGALNVQCCSCGQLYTITPINGKTITMTFEG